MTNVIEIKDKRPARVWECNCGCQLFYIHASGEVECRECKSISKDVLIDFGENSGCV